MKGGRSEGEIVQVQGGHIIRPAGRKDRHSKVYTSRGPRDRRVRLSAHTAIDFYDVQDRLGYDRPSKAVDWLMKKAKSAIDNLAELPPWQINTITNNNAAVSVEANPMGSFHHQIQTQLGGHAHITNNDSSFMPPPSPALDTDAIADTIKSFFPTNNVATGVVSSIHFQNYPADIITRSSSNPCEDLGLSLHTAFQDPTSHHHRHTAGAAASADHHHHQSTNALFTAGLANNNHPNVGSFDSNFQRMLAWNVQETAGAEPRGASGAGGFLFNNSPSLSSSSPQAAAGAAFTQRGPLRPSFTQSVRAWDDIPVGKTELIHHSNSIFGMPASAGCSNPAYHQQNDRPCSSSPSHSNR